MSKIILATTSPYRKEIFGYLGIPFETEGSYYNLLGGIPLETIVEMLREIGYKEEH